MHYAENNHNIKNSKATFLYFTVQKQQEDQLRQSRRHRKIHCSELWVIKFSECLQNNITS